MKLIATRDYEMMGIYKGDLFLFSHWLYGDNGKIIGAFVTTKDGENIAVQFKDGFEISFESHEEKVEYMIKEVNEKVDKILNILHATIS